MVAKSREPREPVSRERALEHALLAMRRWWAGGVSDFDGWTSGEIDPDPMEIFDLDGSALFYDFTVTREGTVIGTIRASASQLIGPAVVAIELGPRFWSAAGAIRSALTEVRSRFPGARGLESMIVCYSYPKIGVQVDFEATGGQHKAMIFDVGDGRSVERFGADEPEGCAAWSFYQEIAAPDEARRGRLWKLDDAELDAAWERSPWALSIEPMVDGLDEARAEIVPPTPFLRLPLYTWRTLGYSPRGRTTKYFTLSSQHKPTSCAAAVAQMILDFHHFELGQEEIADTLRTSSRGTTLLSQELGLGLLGREQLKISIVRQPSWNDLKAEVDANRPVKAGIAAHARAVAGWARQNRFFLSQSASRWMKVYDPWPRCDDPNEGGTICWERWCLIPPNNLIFLRPTNHGPRSG
jgi:hypothetical protein